MGPEVTMVTVEHGIQFYESMRSTGAYLQCWKVDESETHWVAAMTAERALQVVVETFGFQSVEEYVREFDPVVTSLPYAHQLTVRDIDSGERETKSVAEWIFPLKGDELICSTAA